MLPLKFRCSPNSLRYKKTYTSKILNHRFQTKNSVKNSTNVENFEEFGQKEPWKPAFLTFSTEFSTKLYAFARVFNCPKNLLLPFCNIWKWPTFTEYAFSVDDLTALKNRSSFLYFTKFSISANNKKESGCINSLLPTMKYKMKKEQTFLAAFVEILRHNRPRGSGNSKPYLYEGESYYLTGAIKISLTVCPSFSAVSLS